MNALAKKLEDIIDTAIKENRPISMPCTATNDELRNAMSSINLRRCEVYKATPDATEVTATPKELHDAFFG